MLRRKVHSYINVLCVYPGFKCKQGPYNKLVKIKWLKLKLVLAGFYPCKVKKVVYHSGHALTFAYNYVKILWLILWGDGTILHSLKEAAHAC